MLTHLPRPAIFAHRGASAHAPENTLAAFTLAIRQGADAIELDAKLTADGHVIVIHDQTVERVSNGSGWVKNMSLAEIRALEVGAHFDIAFAGERIPTLDEVFAVIGQQTFINVELTNYISLLDDLPQRVAALVERHNLRQRAFFSSFNPVALRRIHRLLPEIPICLLARPGRQGRLARGWFGRWLVPYQALHVAARDIVAATVEDVHRRGHRLHAFTVNQPAEIRRLIELGVDGIFTDDPLMARQVLSDS